MLKAASTVGTQGIHPRIGPDVAPVATVLAELEVVDVGRRAVLEDQDQLVLTTVERAHARVGFDPDDELLEGRIGHLPNRQNIG